jgi:hypothetical protein
MRIIRWTDDGGWTTDIDQSPLAYPVDETTSKRLTRIYHEVFGIEYGISKSRHGNSRLRRNIFGAMRKRLAAIVWWPGSNRARRS